MTVEPSATPTTPMSPARTQAVLMADLVEYVRLMQHDAADTVQRWSSFVDEVRRELLPARGGRFVRSEGDSLLVTFDHCASAAATAVEMHRRLERWNERRGPEAALRLRVGLDHGEVRAAAGDLHGTAVNVAHRLMTLASPGETWVSVELRDRLVPGVDPDAEDLGEVHLKHIAEPVRVYRLGPRATALQAVEAISQRLAATLRPGIAVLPFEWGVGGDADGVLGEALADELIAQLARSHRLHVISGLSSRGMRGRQLTVQEVGRHLGAAYVVSGRYRQGLDRLRLSVELAAAESNQVVWAESFDTTVRDAFDPDGRFAADIVRQLARAILQHEMERASTQPLAALEGYSLLFNALALMHRQSPSDFARARSMLDELAFRYSRSSIPHAWLAKWHVLNVAQGWSADVDSDTREALTRSSRALDANAQDSLALAIGGHVHGYLRKDSATAGQMYEEALTHNPNEPLAWLYRGVWHAYRGEPTPAEESVTIALRLSPIDPMRSYFDSLAATALLSGQQRESALALAQRAVRGNRWHVSSWRTLTYALVLNERFDEARAAVEQLRRMQPAYTLSTFRARFPGRDGPMAEPWAAALKVAGLPE